ncbi:hypothetical protein F4821DRAFT_263372 [Hypoxylon rubiginosum]|uniref:Uncharacterized protein n=1 Tax=Hypoxylon rubiginosum TaxID=110542 RepID=A0ACC0CRV1_9PEZI|nr:hypothetical protein F4821DRAFT_263372 [Hypoxylon rubiginosum]
MYQYNQLPDKQSDDAANASPSSTWMFTGLHNGMQPATGPSQQASNLHGDRFFDPNHTTGKPYGCVCGAGFTRLDALKRHIATQSNDVSQWYPCDYCEGHRGEKAFRRYDDLIQHLKGPHKDQDIPMPSRAATNKAAANTLRCLLPRCNKPYGYLDQAELDGHQFTIHYNDLLPSLQS